MEKKKLTIQDFQQYKENGHLWTWSICYDFTMAGIIDESKTEMILVGDSLGNIITGCGSTVPVTVDEIIHHVKAVVRGAPHTFVVGDMPFGSYHVSNEQAIDTACRIMKEGGCDCVKLEGGANVASRIKAIVDVGIPVMAHIGLTPQTASAIGGNKLQGKVKESADKIFNDAIAVQDAGAFAICLECIPSAVAHRIAKSCRIPTCGIGAGPHTDGQELNLYDLTGIFNTFRPKFVKHFAELRQPIIDALNSFHEETCARSFPSPEYCYNTVPEGYDEWK